MSGEVAARVSYSVQYQMCNLYTVLHSTLYVNFEIFKGSKLSRGVTCFQRLQTLKQTPLPWHGTCSSSVTVFNGSMEKTHSIE